MFFYNRIASLNQWERGAEYEGGLVRTFHKEEEGKYWCGRGSLLGEVSEEMYGGVLRYLIGVEVELELDLNQLGMVGQLELVEREAQLEQSDDHIEGIDDQSGHQDEHLSEHLKAVGELSQLVKTLQLDHIQLSNSSDHLENQELQLDTPTHHHIAEPLHQIQFDSESHTRYEKQYIHALQRYKVIEKNSNSITVLLVYDIGPIFKKREFHVKITFQLPVPHSKFGGSEDEEISMVISEPVDGLEKESGTVLGSYRSVELLVYNRKKRTLQWDMCTSSNAGGCLPQWLQNLGIAKSISKDVPSFISFLKQKGVWH